MQDVCTVPIPRSDILSWKGLQTFLFGEKVVVAREGSGGQIVEGAMRHHKDAVEVSVHIDN